MVCHNGSRCASRVEQGGGRWCWRDWRGTLDCGGAAGDCLRGADRDGLQPQLRKAGVGVLVHRQVVLRPAIHRWSGMEACGPSCAGQIFYILIQQVFLRLVCMCAITCQMLRDLSRDNLWEWNYWGFVLGNPTVFRWTERSPFWINPSSCCTPPLRQKSKPDLSLLKKGKRIYGFCKDT